MMEKSDLFPQILQLLQKLIAQVSYSKEESDAAQIIRDFFSKQNIPYSTRVNNTWAFNQYYKDDLPTVLLNSHIDTVKANAHWTKDPFSPTIEGDKLYGLGSNDAGGALVSLIGAFLYFYEQKDLPFNLCIAATAEEEISGQNGIALISDITENCAVAIVGEPTENQMATAERGLMVVDATVHGVAGHAARNTGVNAIYLAVDDLQWFRTHQLDKQCPVLGPTKMTVTMIEAGKQHNVIPDLCTYVIDIRTTAAYEYQELIDFIQSHVHAKLKPRSMRLKPSLISEKHPIVQAAKDIGIQTFGSATLSDQSLLKIPSVKLGPGKSERSHTSDEFIYLEELEQGLHTYINLLKHLKWPSQNK